MKPIPPWEAARSPEEGGRAQRNECMGFRENAARKLVAAAERACPPPPRLVCLQGGAAHGQAANPPKKQEPLVSPRAGKETPTGIFSMVLAEYRRNGLALHDLFRDYMGRGTEEHARTIALRAGIFTDPLLQANFSISMMVVYEYTRDAGCAAAAADAMFHLHRESPCGAGMALSASLLARIVSDLTVEKDPKNISYSVGILLGVLGHPAIMDRLHPTMMALSRVSSRADGATDFCVAVEALGALAARSPCCIGEFLSFLTEAGRMDNEKRAAEVIADAALAAFLAHRFYTDYVHELSAAICARDAATVSRIADDVVVLAVSEGLQPQD
ncbi:MAG: hypothetical protein AB1657_02860 [Candidatus Micrarchaeota archaeon]